MIFISVYDELPLMLCSDNSIIISRPEEKREVTEIQKNKDLLFLHIMINIVEISCLMRLKRRNECIIHENKVNILMRRRI